MKRPSDNKPIEYARIIWARVADRNGFIKERPAVIVSDPARAQPGDPLVVIAITTTFPEPAPEWHVPLPWNRDGRRAVTELSARSAAVVGWFDTVKLEDVLERRGTVPIKQMRRIEDLIRLWNAATSMRNEVDPADED